VCADHVPACAHACHMPFIGGRTIGPQPQQSSPQQQTNNLTQQTTANNLRLQQRTTNNHRQVDHRQQPQQPAPARRRDCRVWPRARSSCGRRAAARVARRAVHARRWVHARTRRTLSLSLLSTTHTHTHAQARTQHAHARTRTHAQRSPRKEVTHVPSPRLPHALPAPLPTQ
jgi:hypothetical protein